MSGVLVMAGVAFVAMVTGGLLVYWVRGNRRGPDWALFEQNPQPVFVWEEGSGRILAANQSACDAYGFSRDEFVSMSAFDLRLEDPDSQRAPLPTAGSVVERAHRRRDGSVREGEVYTSTAHWRGKPAMMALVVDVTERNQSERQARRISRFYATASKINRTIFGLHGQAEMFQAACDIAVEAGEFPLAWIGVPNETTGFLEVAASAGSASAYLANIRVTMRGDVPEGRGPLGTAMRERRIVRENDFLNSWTATPWRSDAARHGLRALLCAPIERDGAVVAGFGLYGSDAGMFGEQETRLIAELTSDITLALEDLERQTRLELDERIRHLTMEVYELIATDAPLDAVFARLSDVVNEHSPQTIAQIALSCELAEAQSAGSDIVVPVVGAAGQTLGSLRLACAPAAPPSAADLAFFKSIAQLASIAIERNLTRERLEHQALHDGLTDLPNRLLFDDRLAQALAATRRRSTRVAVGLVDLDRFKLINDTLGHAQGDTLLRAVAERFRGCVRADETVARMGGDEFLVIFTDLRHASEADAAARRMLATLEQPFRIGSREIFVRASLGMVLADRIDRSDIGVLLQRADRAMYRAKRSGAGYVLDAGLAPAPARDLEDLDLESDLHRALQRNELVLHYQPFYDQIEERIVAVEALIRWQHPERGLIAPEHFIPLAEASGLIVPMGAWTIGAACKQAAQWARNGLPLPVAVNISARQFAQPGLQATVVQALAQHNVPADRLWLEVTETSVMESPDSAAAILSDLKRIGVHIAIDDFGTGYSSLAYLHRFPIDMLKIDRSFISGMGESPSLAAGGMEIARAIVALAEGLNADVLAEGVETVEQRNTLLSFGCRLMQGFLFSPPLLAREIAEMVDADACEEA